MNRNLKSAWTGRDENMSDLAQAQDLTSKGTAQHTNRTSPDISGLKSNLIGNIAPWALHDEQINETGF